MDDLNDTDIPLARVYLVRDFIVSQLLHAYGPGDAVPYNTVSVGEPDDWTTVVLVNDHPVFMAWDSFDGAAGRLLLGEPSPELMQALGLGLEA